jgi:cystathionine gamma-lyase
MQDATRVIRAGLPEVTQGEGFLRGPAFAGTYHLKGDPSGSEYSYGRTNNPTWVAYERAIGELEQAAATVVFASGAAAITATLGVTLKPGDVVVMPSDGYYGSRLVANEFFSKFGVDVRFAPTRNNAQSELLKGAKLLWLESPSNPGLDVCDIRLLAAAAHAERLLVAVDNSTPSPIGQKPLTLGADFNVSSDSKITSGHSDLILGHVSVSDAVWGDKLREWRARVGSTPGPMEVWLAHRSLVTLDVRLRRQCENALLIAAFLASREDVSNLRYPGLSADPAHEIASRQMKLYGPIVSFEIASRNSAEVFLSSCKLVYEATSFGGVHTTAERRARWGGDTVGEGFIRLSVGCEDAQDLIADLSQALDRAHRR